MLSIRTKSLLLSIAAFCTMAMLSVAGPSTVVAADCDGTIDPKDPLGVDCVGATGLTNQPVGVIVGRIIQVGLSLLGIVVLALILWAGFRWMTSAGNSEQVENAKKTLIAAVIGLIIIFTAYSLTTFILSSLYLASTGR